MGRRLMAQNVKNRESARLRSGDSTLTAIRSASPALEDQAISTRPTTDDDPPWYKDAIIYEAHVKSFFDSNDDGIGDLQGLTSKLDYLQELGITCLWLLPFFPSPLKDDGYDIKD